MATLTALDQPEPSALELPQPVGPTGALQFMLYPRYPWHTHLFRGLVELTCCLDGSLSVGRLT